MVFLPKSATVAVGDWDGWVRFHGPDAEANARPLKYPARIWSLAVSPDGSMLAVGGDANKVNGFDLAIKATQGDFEWTWACGEVARFFTRRQAAGLGRGYERDVVGHDNLDRLRRRSSITRR